MSTPLPPPAGAPLPQPPAGLRCKRHPDREAGRHCTRCGQPACAACLVQADVGSLCVDCARRARPNVRDRANLWNARQPVLVTYTLIGINLAVFVWMALQDNQSLGGRRLTPQMYELGLTEVYLRRPPGLPDVAWDQIQLIPDFPWYRLLTSGFLHFGIIHLLFNMFLLFQLGNMLEPALGRVRFGLVYFAGLFGGSLGILVLQPDGLHGGASGAVFGLLAAAAAGMWRRGINPLTTSIGSLLMINLFITFTLPEVSIGGHLGGLVGGGLAGWVAFAGVDRRATESARTASYVVPAAVIVAAVAGAFLVV